MPIPCSIPSVCYSSKHPQPLCFMLHHHNTQKWHLPSSMIMKTTAFRQGNAHTMLVAELKEKQEENDPTVWVRWRPFILCRAKSFDKQLYADVNWLVISEVFSLSLGTVWVQNMLEPWQLSLSCSSPPFQQVLLTWELLHRTEEMVNQVAQIIQVNTEDNIRS